ncbi:ABC transporter permease [Glycomyces sp. TRM65418]|uniref:ABC transporter permease n=1 Tax=Glycomyces sp. TRM65418 TaxID=2867006 RepID=UPI001CE5059E|nr:ABC transporter permease [Glycomyces sp. TRM65418]MCC3763059.1 ABC transporter permease [Glycomyces sp. TRM65418]QZD57073.1 ABC transporter permease [Glycomyces sp. TRM65418]
MTVLTLAVAESRLILRNRTVLLTAAVLPLIFGLLLSRSNLAGQAPSAGPIAAMQMVMLLVFGLFMAITMTLTARRQQLYLKRLRTSPASTASIVAGLASPLALIVLAQTAVVLAVTAWDSGSAPVHPALLVLAFVNGAVTMTAFGFLTASFTKTPEAAQITVLPGMLVFMAGVFLSFAPGEGPAAALRSAIPGAALAELTVTAWDGAADGAFASIAEPLLVSTAVALLASVIAAKLFRWQPRA